MNLSKYALLLALAGTAAGSTLYLVTGSGQPTTDPAQTARVCGLPSIGPAAFYAALAVPLPTLADGTGSGDCLPPTDAEDLLRKARIAASIIPAWRTASPTSTQCYAGVVAVEYADPGSGAVAQHEELVQVCGPAPSAASTATIEQLQRLPGTSVRLLPGSTVGPYARGAEPVLRRWMEGSYPAAYLSTLLPCACRPTADVAGACLVTRSALEGGGTGPAPFGVTLAAGQWSGPCKRKACSEAAEVIGRRGLGYSLPVECGGAP